MSAIFSRSLTSLRIAERVHFRGFRDDVFAELASIDVLVHASTIPEPFGQVVLEGMAAGVAVIAADEGGPTEIITDNQNGRLFRSRDVASLAGVMRDLADDPTQRARLSSAAVGALASHRPDMITQQLMSFYERVLTAADR